MMFWPGSMFTPPGGVGATNETKTSLLLSITVLRFEPVSNVLPSLSIVTMPRVTLPLLDTESPVILASAISINLLLSL